MLIYTGKDFLSFFQGKIIYFHLALWYTVGLSLHSESLSGVCMIIGRASHIICRIKEGTGIRLSLKFIVEHIEEGKVIINLINIGFLLIRSVATTMHPETQEGKVIVILINIGFLLIRSGATTIVIGCPFFYLALLFSLGLKGNLRKLRKLVYLII